MYLSTNISYVRNIRNLKPFIITTSIITCLVPRNGVRIVVVGDFGSIINGIDVIFAVLEQ